MHKKDKRIAPSIGLTIGLLLSYCMPCMVKANPTYSVRSITITATAAIAPITVKRYPCLRLVQWLAPTTDATLIRRYIGLEAGADFDGPTLLAIKRRLMALPYFSMVSITRKRVEEDSTAMLADLMIETKDRFPISVGFNLDEGPLFTLTHHNAWGYGHRLSQHFFLKKRWGYGVTYELPKLHSNYFFGGQHYNQRGNGYGNETKSSYRFNYQNLWMGQLLAIETKEPYAPYYWITGLSGARKRFMPAVWETEHKANYTFILGKVGWVADDYTTIRSVYSLHTLERLPKGGSIEILYGYQKGALNNRHYMGISCIKNIASPTLRYLHLSCESGTFMHKKRLEEVILKLALAYAGPPIETCNGARLFMAIDYIMGYRMPKERMLGIRRRDPEALEPPDSKNSMQAPIHARLNVHLSSSLHMPIMVASIRFVCLGFTDFIALYNQYNALLNQTFIDSFGVGLQLEHATMPWLAAIFKLGYNPLLGKAVPSVQFAMGHFKNKRDPKPTQVAYS